MKREHRIDMAFAGNPNLSEEEKKRFEEHLQIAIVETLFQKKMLTYVQRELCLKKMGVDSVKGLHP